MHEVRNEEEPAVKSVLGLVVERRVGAGGDWNVNDAVVELLRAVVRYWDLDGVVAA